MTLVQLQPVSKARNLGNLREDSRKYLEYLGNRVTGATDKYARVNSLDLIEQTLDSLNKLGYNDVDVAVRGHHGKSTKHFITYELRDNRIGIDGGIIPRIIQMNSYDRECSLQIHVGFMRLVCTNGMMAGRNFFCEKIVHLKGETFDRKIAGLQPAIVAAVAAIEDKLAARIIYLKSQEVATVFEAREIVESLKFSKTTTRKIVDALENAWLFEYGRPEDRKRNLWTLTNIVNEVLRRRSRSAVAEMNKNVNLFDLVESIAKAA